MNIAEPIRDNLDMNGVMDAEFLVRNDGTILMLKDMLIPQTQWCVRLYMPQILQYNTIVGAI